MAQTQNHSPLLLFLIITIITFSTTPPPPILVQAFVLRSLVAPITKDPSTSLYTISIKDDNSSTASNLLLDLAGPLLWSPCNPNHPTFYCKTSACVAARAFGPRDCGADTCPYNCTSFPVNPVTGTCASGDLTDAGYTVDVADGVNAPSAKVTLPIFLSCAPPCLLKSLPVGTAGVAGLSRANLALPSQLVTSLAIKNQFAVCLPSSTTNGPGVAFFGSGPYNMMPPTPFDVSSILSYTRLIKSKTNPAYYINLQGIAVNGAKVPVSVGPSGSGVMLSTTIPYTQLRSSIYRPFLESYAKASKDIPRMPSVRPFDLCFNSSAMGTTRVGYRVPLVDLMLPKGKNWTVSGVNSMKQVAQDTACLAFVDGGEKAEQAVVIGGFQMENNFLLFDEAKSRLGFSSSLFFVRTSCGNYNMTTI